MDDTPPIGDMLGAPRRRPDGRIVATALVSVLVHLALLALLLAPALVRFAPEAPDPIEVELVPPEAALSLEPPSPPSTGPLSSEEPPPSDAPISSEQPSAEPAAGAAGATASEPPSSEAPSSQVSEPPSSAAPSAEPASSAPPPSAEPSSAPSEAPPVPATRPVVIPVAPDASEEPSTESSAMAETPSALTANGGAADGAEAADENAPPPPVEGALHVARRFYLKDMLDAPALSKAREAIGKLTPEKRLAQTCNIEAVGQIGHAGRDFSPDALVADAFAPPSLSGASFTVTGGAFRSRDKWYALAYDCVLSADLTAVRSFSYRIGGEVAVGARGGRPASAPAP